MTEFAGRLFAGRLFAGRLFRTPTPAVAATPQPTGRAHTRSKPLQVTPRKRRDRDDDVLLFLLMRK